MRSKIDLPKNVREQARVIDGSDDWDDFIVSVMNIAAFDLPTDMRIGQKLMNGLGSESPWMYEKISNTPYDIWELDDPYDPRISKFFEKVFELFVEAL